MPKYIYSPHFSYTDIMIILSIFPIYVLFVKFRSIAFLLNVFFFFLVS